MEKRNKRETKKRDTKPSHRGRKLSKPLGVRSQTPKRRDKRAEGPKPAMRRLEATDKPPRRSCFDCVFSVSNMVLWLRTLFSAFPVGGMCANHPDTPGQLRPIPHTPCRNFRGKPYRVDPPEPPNDKIRYIPLTRGLHAIVDAEDYEWLSQYKWQAHRTPSGGIYAVHGTSRGQVFMHRMIMRPPEGMVVDHINGNGLDNRRCNLRICTPPENSRNRRKHVDGKSRFIGVSPCGEKWQVFVGRRYVGVFDDEVEAAKIRDREAIKQYGEHAWLNFPPDSPEAEGSRR